MQSLAARMLVALVAAAIMGMSLLSVAAFRWSQVALVREQGLYLQAEAGRVARLQARRCAPIGPAPSTSHAAAATQPNVPQVSSSSQPAAWAQVTVAIVNPGDTTAAARGITAAPVFAMPLREGAASRDGYRFYGVQACADAFVVASAPWSAVVDRVLFLQTRLWLLLLMAVTIIVGFGLWFLRRAVLVPLARLTDAVQAVDASSVEVMQSPLVSQLHGNRDLTRLGHAIQGMGSRIDVDRRKIATQLTALRQAHEQLSAAQQQLIRSERLAVTGQLAAGLAHEIGNPLAIVIGYVDILDDVLDRAGIDPGANAIADPLSPLPPSGSRQSGSRQEILSRIKRELERIHHIVRGLLDFSRAGSDAYLATGPGDVAEAVRQVVDLLQGHQRFRDVVVKTHFADPPASVPLPTHAVVQVLLNLLLNAAEAVDGSGHVDLTVQSTSQNAVAGVTIDVDDDGCGMSPQQRARAFEPFYTGRAAQGGSGLGLAVCRSIVEAVGGTISIEPSRLGGACFKIWVPTAPAQ